jgi:hypothetical protein
VGEWLRAAADDGNVSEHQVSQESHESPWPLLIGLTAWARGGKDAVADILASEGFTRTAFADPIYNVILTMNPLVKVKPTAGWRYRLRPHRRLGELVAEHGWHWIKEHSPEGRRLLNTLGAAIRDYDNDFWVKATMGGLEPGKRYVLADCRFPAEVDALRAHGGVLVRITRPGVGPARDPLTGQPYLSEMAVVDVAEDFALVNDGPTLEHLEADTVRLLRRIESAPGNHLAA